MISFIEYKYLCFPYGYNSYSKNDRKKSIFALFYV